MVMKERAAREFPLPCFAASVRQVEKNFDTLTSSHSLLGEGGKIILLKVI